MTTTTYLLTGDIGGTSSRMSLYATNTSCSTNEPLIEKKYRNHEALPDHVRSEPNAFGNYVIIPFLEYCWEQQHKIKLEPLESSIIFCCLAPAGIVSDNKVQMTNLGNLLIDGNAIQAYHRDRQNDPTAFSKKNPMLVENKYLNRIVQCHIINDFVAQGYGCLTLTDKDVQHLYGPKIPPQELTKGPKVCVGAGTGLGECYLTQSHLGEGTYTCFPSEGGHVEYAARNELEVALFHALNEKFSTKHRISVERVVSGTGLANVYEFLVEYYPHRVDVNLHEKYVKAPPDEKPAIVSKRAHEEDDAEKKHPGKKKTEPSLCRLAMDTMMSAYGCEVGSAAIKWIPTGGLFVTGGLTPKNMQFIQGEHSEFFKSYLHKGRVSTLLERIPLYAVKVEDLGVRGAHKAAQMAFEKYSSTRQQPGFGGRGGGGSGSTWQWTTTTTLVVTAAAAALGFAVGVTLVKNKRL